MDIEITDDVAKEALQIYVMHPGKPHDGMRAAIRSALPHLTAPAVDGVDGEYWTKKLDALTGDLERLGGLLASTQESYQRGVAVGRADRERETAPDYDKAFRRGVEIGRAEGEATAIDGWRAEAGPSDYEMWRDAWALAAATSDSDYMDGSLSEAEASELLASMAAELADGD